MKILRHLLELATVLMLLASVALQRDGRLFGRAPATGNPPAVLSGSPLCMTPRDDGTVVIDTAELCKNVNGYQGPTPLYIYLKDGKVSLIEAQPNQDTPEFFSATLEEGFREKWYGKTPQEALAVEALPVTGATYSSNAFNENVRQGLAAYLEAQGKSAEVPRKTASWRLPDFRFFCGMLVALAAAILPFFLKHRYYRTIQLLLDVLVLGFWSGVFVSHTLLVKYLSQGIHGREALLPALLLIMAFVYPFFGRKSHYCMHACPFGALQEFAGKCRKRKLAMPSAILKKLDLLRQILWSALLFVMLCGAGFSWMDNEPFTAFLFRSAPPVALTLAVLFTILSLFVQRPYCRFVCPTGSLLKFAESENNPERLLL